MVIQHSLIQYQCDAIHRIQYCTLYQRIVLCSAPYQCDTPNTVQYTSADASFGETLFGLRREGYVAQARGAASGAPGGGTAGKELAPVARDATDRRLKSRGRLLSLLFLVCALKTHPPPRMSTCLYLLPIYSVWLPYTSCQLPRICASSCAGRNE